MLVIIAHLADLANHKYLVVFQLVANILLGRDFSFFPWIME